MRRFTIAAAVVVIIAILAAAVSVIAITQEHRVTNNENRAMNENSSEDGNGKREYRVSGFVTDFNGNRISGVAVSVVDGAAGTKSETDGTFVLKVMGQKSKAVRLQALRTGYKPWDDYVQLPKDDLIIQLEANK